MKGSLDKFLKLKSEVSSSIKGTHHTCFYKGGFEFVADICPHSTSVTLHPKKVKVLVTQSCLTHCDPVDCSPPDSSVRGILQARILEWVASWPRDWTWVSSIADRHFTNWATREEFIVLVTCHVWLFKTPWTVAHQDPLSMEFPRQEYWSGLPFPFPGHLPNPAFEPASPAFQADSLPSEPPGKSRSSLKWCQFHFKLPLVILFQSIPLPIQPFIIYPSIHPSNYLSNYASIHPSIQALTLPSTHPSSMHPSIYSSIHPTIHQETFMGKVSVY